jgi:hypothetical protein
MIYSTYLSNIVNIPNNFHIIRVARPSILGPSEELLHDWRNDLITWDEYRELFLKQIGDGRAAYSYLHKIKDMGNHCNVVIYCYEKDPTHCHRTILMNLLKRIGAKVGGEYGNAQIKGMAKLI